MKNYKSKIATIFLVNLTSKPSCRNECTYYVTPNIVCCDGCFRVASVNCNLRSEGRGSLVLCYGILSGSSKENETRVYVRRPVRTVIKKGRKR
jgi:hypothetical protein